MLAAPWGEHRCHGCGNRKGGASGSGQATSTAHCDGRRQQLLASGQVHHVQRELLAADGVHGVRQARVVRRHLHGGVQMPYCIYKDVAHSGAQWNSMGSKSVQQHSVKRRHILLKQLQC